MGFPRSEGNVAVFADRATRKTAAARVFVTAGLPLRFGYAARPDAGALAETGAALVGEERAMSGINLYCLWPERTCRPGPKPGLSR